jgi:hypothetical protein
MTDVIMHLSYTSVDGGDKLKQNVNGIVGQFLDQHSHLHCANTVKVKVDSYHNCDHHFFNQVEWAPVVNPIARQSSYRDDVRGAIASRQQRSLSVSICGSSIAGGVAVVYGYGFHVGSCVVIGSLLVCTCKVEVFNIL